MIVSQLRREAACLFRDPRPSAPVSTGLSQLRLEEAQLSTPLRHRVRASGPRPLLDRKMRFGFFWAAVNVQDNDTRDWHYPALSLLVRQNKVSSVEVDCTREAGCFSRYILKSTFLHSSTLLLDLLH